MNDKILAAYERRRVALHRTWASSEAMHAAVDRDHRNFLNINRANLLIGVMSQAGVSRQTRKNLTREKLLGSECVQSYEGYRPNRFTKPAE
jgi:hypothetical protein